MPWNKSFPVSGSNIVDIPSIHINNWKAIEDIIDEEHYTFSEALSGRHRPGYVGFLFQGTTSEINSLSSPPSGAISFDSDIGVMNAMSVSTSGWQNVYTLPTTRVNAYRNADYIVSEGTTAVVPFDTEAFDILGEFNNSTYTFSPSADGYFFVSANLSITPIGGKLFEMNIVHSDSSGVEKYSIMRNEYGLSAEETKLHIVALLQIAAGEKIKVTLTHNHSSGIVIEGGSERTYLLIHRVS